MSDARADVVVVGAGLVGAALALGLAQRGFAVRLLERAPALPASSDDYDLRVYALAPTTIRWLAALGVWPTVLAARSSAYRQMRVWENDPHTALQFAASDARLAELGHIVENAVLQQRLWAQLPAGVLQTGVAVSGLIQDEAGSTLQLADGSQLQARLLVVAEGRDSALRARLGIEVLGGAYEQTAVVCHVGTEHPHRQTAYQRFLPTGPLALLPLADGRSSIVWSSSEAAALLALDDEDFRRALGEASQQVLGAITSCTRRLQFPLGLQHAEHYVIPGAVLIGDAAHVVHPLAGQGVNLGFADAAALLETLSVARDEQRDFASLRVLRRYERARRADVLDMIAVTDGLYRAFRLPLPALAPLRDWGFALVNRSGPLKRELVRRAIGG